MPEDAWIYLVFLVILSPLWGLIWHVILDSYFFRGYAVKVEVMLQAEGDIRERLARTWQGNFTPPFSQSSTTTTHRHVALKLLNSEVIPLLIQNRAWWVYGDATHIRARKGTLRETFGRWQAESRAVEFHPGQALSDRQLIGYYVVTIVVYGFDRLKAAGLERELTGTRDMQEVLLALTQARAHNVQGCVVDWSPHHAPRYHSVDQAIQRFPDLRKL